MAAPLTTKRNDYQNKRKESTHNTPLPLARWLYHIWDKSCRRGPATVLDPCCGKGNLLLPWHGRGDFTVGMDIKYFNSYDPMGLYIFGDFLSVTKDQQESELYLSMGRNFDLVVCNPPFNNETTGRKLLPELFLLKIFELFGEETPVMLFSPMGLILNQRMKSKRYQYLRDSCRAEITGRIALPLDIFPGVEFHQEILLWNLYEMRSFYWVPEQVIEQIEEERTHAGKD